jgi:hypothetical protein
VRKLQCFGAQSTILHVVVTPTAGVNKIKTHFIGFNASEHSTGTALQSPWYDDEKDY